MQEVIGSYPILSTMLVLLGFRLVWPKALVFEISIIGSNPITPANFERSIDAVDATGIAF